MTIRRVAGAALSVALVVAVVTAAPAIGATVFTVSGTRVFHPPPYPEQLLPGLFVGDTVTRIDYPAATFGMDASIAVAVGAIMDAVGNTLGDLVAAGFSQGAIAVSYAKLSVMALPADLRPAPDRLSFVTIGDPTAAQGILRVLPFKVPLLDLTPFAPPETPYDTVVVTGEYDGWADLPDRPWNLVSLANALLGIAYVHGRYEVVPGGLDLSTVPLANITATTNSLGGTTTVYLLPTERLPLVQPLRDIGIPEPIVAALEQPLKVMVDAGYARRDLSPATARALSATGHRRPQAGQRSAAKAPATSLPGARKRPELSSRRRISSISAVVPNTGAERPRPP